MTGRQQPITVRTFGVPDLTVTLILQRVKCPVLRKTETLGDGSIYKVLV